MGKRLKWAGWGAAIYVLLAVTVFQNQWVPGIARTRVTLELEVDGQRRTASQVWEFRAKHPVFFDRHDRVYGDAIVMDLGDKGLLCVLLGERLKSSDQDPHKFFIDAWVPRLIRSYELDRTTPGLQQAIRRAKETRHWWMINRLDRLKFYSNAHMLKDFEVVSRDGHPYVWFPDRHNLKSAVFTDEDSISNHLGVRYRRPRLTYRITEDPVDRTLERTFPSVLSGFFATAFRTSVETEPSNRKAWRDGFEQRPVWTRIHTIYFRRHGERRP